MVGGAAAFADNEVGSKLGSDRKRLIVRWRFAAAESGGWRSARVRRWRRRETRVEAIFTNDDSKLE